MKRRKGKGKEGRKGKTKYISMKRTDRWKEKTENSLYKPTPNILHWRIK
jgi:hypothetical protein